MSTPEGVLDLIVVGAGIYGITGATTYLTLNPDANIRILEAEPDVGGVWSFSRTYAKFWSQSGSRVAGFHDVPFKLPEGAESYSGCFDSKVLSKYLEDYATSHGLRERTSFDTSVTHISKDGGVWAVQGETQDKAVTFRACKVMMATGLYTQPNMPGYSGQETFGRPIVHQKDWGKSRLFTPEEPDAARQTHVTVVGGAKSAADIVYAAAADTNHPRTVHWVIRTTGTGPLTLLPAKGLGKYQSLTEVGSTRAIAALSTANPWLPESWWDYFLHKTTVGDWLTDKIWSKSEGDAVALAKFDTREGALDGFKDLKPGNSMRWRTGNFGALQRDPEHYWDVVARNVHVHRSEVEELRRGLVLLGNGEELQTDVLLVATGFKQDHPYFSPSEAARLGLPVLLDSPALSAQQQDHWASLRAAADAKVLARWPFLANPPACNKPPVTRTPYRLHNHMLPLTDHSIVFLGIPLVPNSYHVALVQSLYAMATFEGKLDLPSQQQMEEQIAFIDAWTQRKYPSIGQAGNVVEFEMLSYTDTLLKELGLRSHERDDGWWTAWMRMTEPAWASDYAGLIDEFGRKYLR